MGVPAWLSMRSVPGIGSIGLLGRQALLRNLQASYTPGPVSPGWARNFK